MKRNLVFIALLFSVLFCSCEEDFNPFGESNEQYVLNCILKGDSSFQTVTVARTYSAGFDPLSNTEDPFIPGADVRVWYKDSVYLFKDTLTARNDTSRYNSPVSFYYNNRFSVTNNQPVEIEVTLPTGRRLKSAITTPGNTSFLPVSSSTVPGSNDEDIFIEWSNPAPGIYFLPKFSIVYYKTEGTTRVRYEKDVPLVYENGNAVPMQPRQQASLRISLATLSAALAEISKGDNNKSNYTVDLKPVFKVAAFDASLSRYYSGISKSFDPLTVRVDENDYSNIDGGYGIFGAYTVTKYNNLKFYSSFIIPFGYKVIETY